MPENGKDSVDRQGLYMGLLKVHYMCDESGAYSGWDRDILEDWMNKKKDRKRPRRRN